MTIPTEFNRVWTLLERCWGTTPDTRPTALWVLEVLRDDIASPLNEKYDIEFPSFLPRTSLPKELLIEGRGWYALHNPRLPKALLVELVYELNLFFISVNYIRYFLVMLRTDLPREPNSLTDSVRTESISLLVGPRRPKFSIPVQEERSTNTNFLMIHGSVAYALVQTESI
jgi:hypothetical protein